MTPFRFVLVVAAALLLAACGGGATAHTSSTPQSSQPPKAATPTPAPAPQVVVFKVWGDDGGQGTDINYGSNANSQQTTAQLSASNPPWQEQLPYDGNAEFYSVTASPAGLTGNATLHCSVTVKGKTKTGQSGGAAACDAQLSNVLGGWS